MVEFEFVVGVDKPGSEPCNIAGFTSHDRAIEYIHHTLVAVDPAGVAAGDYYLDGPSQE